MDETRVGGRRLLALFIAAGLVVVALALIWEGAGRGCAPGSLARTVSAALGYAQVAVAGVAVAVALPMVRMAAWGRWWLAAVVTDVVLFFAGIFQFAIGCAA